MRFFLVTLFFFFAPVILMFALRHLVLLLRIWMAWKRSGKRDANVIDITPSRPAPASRVFIALAVLLGIVCASMVWMRLGAPDVPPQGVYVPAHVDPQGNLIPGHYRKP